VINKKKISILITNYNTVDFIKLSLDSIQALTKNPFQVIINDNGSNNKDIKELQNLEKQKNIYE